MNHSRNALLALASLLAIAGCDLDQKQALDSPQTRSFAPRLVGVPTCDRVRVEVAEYPLTSNNTNTSGNSVYRNMEAQWNQGKIVIDGLPTDRPLYFRISGLDVSATVVWSASNPIPDGTTPTVTIGGSGAGAIAPKTLSAPSIAKQTDSFTVQIQCTNSWPAWSFDGNTPSSGSSSMQTSPNKSATATVQLNIGQKITARCTDDFLWGDAKIYGAPSNPNDLCLRQSGNSFGPPSINLGPSGQNVGINLSVDSIKQLAPGYQNWFVIYQIGGTGTPIITSVPTRINYAASGNITAYAIAWNGSSWMAGSQKNVNFLNGGGSNDPIPTGPDTTFNPPTIFVPSTTPTGSITFDAKAIKSANPSYSSWKLVYMFLPSGTTWSTKELSDTSSISYNGSGTIKVYLMAYNGTSWASGISALAAYPKSTTIPDFAILPPDNMITQSPNINIAVNPAAVSYPTGIQDYSKWHIVYNTISSAGPYTSSLDLQMNNQIPLSGSGTLYAYLMAWSQSQGKWVSGQPYPFQYSSGTGQPTIIDPGSATLSLNVTAPQSCLNGSILMNPSATSGPYSNLKLVYQFGSAPASRQLIDWVPAGVSIPCSGTSGTVIAYLMALSGTSWVAGPAATADYPSNSLPGAFTIRNPGGILTQSPNVQWPTVTPWNVFVAAPTILDADLSNWHIVYKTSADSNPTYKQSDLTTQVSIPLYGNGTFYGYLMAWSKSKKDWVSGPLFSKVYSTGPTEPVAIGPKNELVGIIINTPKTPNGIITFSINGGLGAYSNWKIAYKTTIRSISSEWLITDLNGTGVNVNDSGKIDAYLMAWNGSKWLAGPQNSANFPDTPSLPPLPYMEGVEQISVSINAPTTIPGWAKFNTTSTNAIYSRYKVAYRTTMAGNYNLVNLGDSAWINSTGNIQAFLMAWKISAGSWFSGQSSNAYAGPSSSNPEIIGSQPTGPLPAPIILGQPQLPAKVTFQRNSATAMYSNFQIVYSLDNGTSWKIINVDSSVIVPTATTITAYLEAWNSNASGGNWVSGPTTSLILPTVSAPIFKDTNGKSIDTLEADGISISLNIFGSGTIYYTTDGMTPTPGIGSSTSKWMIDQSLSFPLGVDNMAVQAVTVKDGSTSTVARLYIVRPLWNRKDGSAVGCMKSLPNAVYACGDNRGPLTWDTTSSAWVAIDRSWSKGRVKFLEAVGQKMIAATTDGQVWVLDQSSASTTFSRVGAKINLNSIGGASILNDTLWITVSGGPRYLDIAQDTWMTPPSAAGQTFNGTEGPVYSDGTYLWCAYGSTLWRKGSGSAMYSYNDIWNNWGSIGNLIPAIGPDPFNASNLAVGYNYGAYQVLPTTYGFTSNYMNSNGATLQLVSFKGIALAAMDNGTGDGGVGRSTGWGTPLNTLYRNWPNVSGHTIASQGIGKFYASGSYWLLASTAQGTYIIRLI